MNILLVSLLKREVTPTSTAARVQIIYQLAQGLIQKGHSVTVLGTGDSIIPGATVVSVIDKAFIHQKGFENPFYAETGYLVAMAKKLREIGDNFDLIHNHTYPEFINLLVEESIQAPMISTIHVQVTEEVDHVLSLFSKSRKVAISAAQKQQFKQAHIDYIVYNGVDTAFYTPAENPTRDYFLFVGRVSKAKDGAGKYIDPKGVTNAIAATQKAGVALKIVGNVEDRKFYDELIAPHLSESIQFVGDVSLEQHLSKEEVRELYRHAKAFLFPINWEEPFGLVIAEAGSCGTPVISFKRGAVPEIVVDGKTGFVVEPEHGIDGLAEAMGRIETINPRDCREHIVNNFSINHMVNGYEKVYTELVHEKT